MKFVKVWFILLILSFTGCGLDTYPVGEIVLSEDEQLVVDVISSYNTFREDDAEGFDEFLEYFNGAKGTALTQEDFVGILKDLPGYESLEGVLLEVKDSNAVLISTLEDLGDIAHTLEEDSVDGLIEFTDLLLEMNERAPEIREALLETAKMIKDL